MDILINPVDAEAAAQARYREALASGLSDAEAREEGWPDRQDSLIPDALFRLLLNLTMQADPHPWSALEDEQLKRHLDAESLSRGFETWVVAYHQFGAWQAPDGDTGRTVYRSAPVDGTEEQQMWLAGWTPVQPLPMSVPSERQP